MLIWSIITPEAWHELYRKGFATIVLPDRLYPDERWDKWGNMVARRLRDDEADPAERLGLAIVLNIILDCSTL